MIRSTILDSIYKAVKEEKGLKEEEIKLDSPQNESFGDYSTNIAMILAKQNNKNPREVAESIISNLKSDQQLMKLIEKIDVAGPGFINFTLKEDVLIDNLIQIDSEKRKYGTSDIGKGKTVIIDYSSPNIAKPFGIGHLRSTIIGQALYNLYKSLGYEVVGDNHLGDWGTQFGKLLYMIKKEDVKSFDIAKLEELYIKFHDEASDPKKAEEMEKSARLWFRKLEEGDSEARSIWQKCVDVSMTEFNRIYKLLGVSINFAFGESYYLSEMKQMLNKNSKIWNYVVNGGDGAQIVYLTNKGIKTPLMLLKSDGATTYATRDLATLSFRSRKWDPDIIIYEVGAEQTLYFKQVFAAAKLLKLVNEKVSLVHTAHGLYLAPDGKKFSTRKGKTIKLEEVLDEAIKRAQKLGNSEEETSKQVGIGAIKYFDLMHAVGSDVVFDWEKIMNMEGNSGPYLQYTVARINSVLAKAQKGEIKKKEELNPTELSLIRSLIKFQDILTDAAKNYAPNILCNYLYNLASKFNSFYNDNKIIGSSNQDIRLAICAGTLQVLKNGLLILGIDTPEKM